MGVTIDRDSKGLCAKLKNRRVEVWKCKEGWVLRFKKLDDERKVVRTDLALSDDAMMMVADMYIRLARGRVANERKERTREN